MSYASPFDHPGRLSSNTTPPMPKASEISLGKSGQKSSKLGHISTQVWAERVAGFLRAKYPHKTADVVAADLDVSASTVRKWLDQSSAPDLGNIARMVQAYEWDFLLAVFPGLSFCDVVVALTRRDTAARMAIEAQAQVDVLLGRQR